MGEKRGSDQQEEGGCSYDGAKPEAEATETVRKKRHRMIEDQAHIEADTGCLSEPDGWWELAIIIDCT